jgi:hypothetical protein
MPYILYDYTPGTACKCTGNTLQRLAHCVQYLAHMKPAFTLHAHSRELCSELDTDGDGAAPDPALSNLHTALYVTASELPALRWNFNFLSRFVFFKDCTLMAQDIPVSQFMGSAVPDSLSVNR